MGREPWWIVRLASEKRSGRDPADFRSSDMISSSGAGRWLVRWMALACLAFGAAGALRAGDLQFPADGSAIALTLPDGWTSAEDKDGSLKCTSADGEFSFELFPSKILHDPKANLAEVAQSLAEAAGLAEVKTQDGGEKANPHGTKITGIIVIGRKGDDAYAGVVSIITPSAGDFCAFQCFGTKSTLLVHSKEMARITASFRAVK